MDRIPIGGAGIWPIVFEDSKSEAQSARIASLHFEELTDPDPQMIGVQNSTPFPSLLPSGLIIGGLNQSRMVPIPTLIPAKMTVGIDVFCVEEDRFGNHLSARIAGRAPTTLWLIKDSSLGQSRIRRRSPRTDQTSVWSDIRDLSDRLQKGSERALDKLISSVPSAGSSVEINPALWGRAQGYAVEVEGSLLMVERLPNSDDARLMALATAASYLSLLPEAHLFESKESVTRYLCRIVQKSFDSFPSADFSYLETRSKFDEIVHFEFTNFQNRILLNA